jgi:hypothetical protein
VHTEQWYLLLKEGGMDCKRENSGAYNCASYGCGHIIYGKADVCCCPDNFSGCGIDVAFRCSLD